MYEYKFRNNNHWNSSVIPLNKGVIKPLIVDRDIIWSCYRRQKEYAVVFNEWIDEDEVTALMLPLGGKSLEMRQSIPEVAQENYAIIELTLVLIYGSPYFIQEY